MAWGYWGIGRGDPVTTCFGSGRVSVDGWNALETTGTQ